jgi:hypothetical protein
MRSEGVVKLKVLRRLEALRLFYCRGHCPGRRE